MSGNLARRFEISGRVQGVGFRAATVRTAESLGLVGWVRNTDDGGVTVFAQGSSDPIKSLARWVESGPPWARVDRVISMEASVDPGLRRFDIRW